jgi:hypothetical protein
MNQLLPIIRRKRRPLMVADATPVAVGKAVETSPAAADKSKPAEPESKPKADDGDRNTP